MKLQTVKDNFNRGRMNIDDIKWLIDSFELVQEENGAMAEKHAEKSIAIADFMQIVELQRQEIELFKLTETLLLERLKKQTSEIKELKRNSRTIRFFEMVEENLKLAEENARLKDLVNV